MVNTLCHMVFQCQTRLVITVAMLINHVFFYVGFSTKACHRFGRPQTWALNIYICVGTSLIGCLDGKHILQHGFSVPDKSSNYCSPCSSTMCFSMLASQPRHAMGLEGLKQEY